MKIIVLAGGLSLERDVSLTSGASICKALREKGHDAFLLDVYLGLEYDKDKLAEVFTLPDGGLGISDGIKTTIPDLKEVASRRVDDGRVYFGPNVIDLCSLADITFMALHGSVGENGKIQAAFDLLGVRYTGTGSLGCALSMDKLVAKQIFKMSGVPTPRGTSLKYETKDTPLEELGYYLPLVVKPCNNGSSIGVYICHTKEEYEAAVKQSFTDYPEDEIIVEPYIKGREFASAVFGGKALPLVEIIPKDESFDYANKYQTGGAQEICPPVSIDQATCEKIQRACELAYEVLHMEVYARADFIVDESDGEIYCFEMNALPGMTPASLIPLAASAAGMAYGDFCEAIIEESLKLRYQ
ncbi:D-alanine-D-alanine ligase [Lachnospiraceae bacterium PM6-15]|uniref:D-alanine--D-alanine ligase family protein n=1 Tax=Ohessyouella blattaphilus TaxID=2949333 RepID=UPI003E1FCD48